MHRVVSPSACLLYNQHEALILWTLLYTVNSLCHGCSHSCKPWFYVFERIWVTLLEP
jgi:hypothetical protein